MVAWRYEISLLVLKKYFTSERSERVKYFSTLEEKFRISVRPCNILYVIHMSSKRPFLFESVPWLLPSTLVRKELNLLCEILHDS